MKNSLDSSNMSSKVDDDDDVVVEVMVNDDKSTSLFVGCVGELGEFLRRQRLEMVFNNFPILLIFPPPLFLRLFSNSIFSPFSTKFCD